TTLLRSVANRGYVIMALTDVLFYVLAVLTGVCALAVVVTQNIVRAAAWLLFTLAGVSGLFFLLGADFVGATQLLVYVGGTLVLVVFGVMLTAQGPFINMRIGAAEWAIALSVGLVLYGILAASLIVSQARQPSVVPLREGEMAGSTVLGAALLGQAQTASLDLISGVPASVGRPRQSMAYLLPFEIVSVHLLVVLIGAAYLARAKRRRSAAAPGREQQLGVTI
ncbi:MAG: NADH-quinone oxidoreductase subunit J family protein, partial [Gemmataceae bacterium]